MTTGFTIGYRTEATHTPPGREGENGDSNQGLPVHPAAGDRRIAVSHARFDLVTLFPVWRFGYFVETTFVDPMTTANWRLTTWDDQSFSTVSERLLFTWQQEEDPRVGGFQGSFDLRGQIVNRP